MRPEQIGDALTNLSEDLVTEALQNRGKQKKSRIPRILGIGVAASLILVTGLLLWGSKVRSLPDHMEGEQHFLYRSDKYLPTGLDSVPPVSTPALDEEPQPAVSEDSPTVPTSVFSEEPPAVLSPPADIEGDSAPEDVSVTPTPTGHLLFAPQYPKMSPYPTAESGEETRKQWMEDKEQFYASVKDFEIPEGFMDFYHNTAQIFLAERQGENATYSPLNLYLALSMLAEITGGSTRQELLALLGTETIEEVRENTAAFWLSNYCDDGVLTCKLGNSIWLRDDMLYKEKTLSTLAEIYRAASYSGNMGSAEFTQDLRHWINEHTGGLLKNQAEQVVLDERMVVALVSAIHFKARWTAPFLPQNTKDREFYGANRTITMDFMHRVCTHAIYNGENFTAVKLPMSDGTAMWFFLPHEGTSPQDLLEQDAIYHLPAYGRGANKQTVKLSLYLPKFDITAETELVQGLAELGLTEVFHPMVSDFSPLTEDAQEIVLTKAEHCARVKIDEEGSEAVAFTVISMYAGIPADKKEEVELVFDRPFVFVITGRTGDPLFTGIVDQP